MYPESEYKNVNWALFGQNVPRKLNPKLASRLVWGASLQRSRTILSRRLTFKANSKLKNAFVGVS
jgi:hypothetical protein